MATTMEHVVRISENMETASVDDVVETLNLIVPKLKSDLTSAYLQKKIDALCNDPDDTERRIKCMALKPYLDWYVQGLRHSDLGS